MITVVSPDSEKIYYKVPVVFTGQSLLEAQGLMVTSDTDLSVELKLSGNRTDLDKVNSGNIRLLADLSKISRAGTQYLPLDISYPGNVASDAFTVQYYEPSSITLMVERKITKSVPIEVIYQGTVKEEYIADKENVLLTDTAGLTIPENAVKVTGPESVINQIAKARFEVDMKDRYQSFSESFRYTLCDEQNQPVDAQLVETNVEAINLTMIIQRVKEIPLVVTVVEGGGATEQNSSIVIEPPVVKVCGSDALLEGILEINLGTINLGTMENNEDFEFAIAIPDGVTNLSGETMANVSVSFPALQVKTFNVTNLVPQNVPADLEAEILTKKLPVKVRGPKELVEKMKETDITVTVDFSGAQLGSFMMKPGITMGPGYETVGTMGTYTVSATLREPVVEVTVDDPVGQGVEDAG